MVLLALVAVPVPASAAAPAAETAPGRLSRQVEPASEAIRLVLDPAREDYEGSIRVDLRVKERTSAFRLHAEELTLQEVTLQGPAGELAGRTKGAGGGGAARAQRQRP